MTPNTIHSSTSPCTTNISRAQGKADKKKLVLYVLHTSCRGGHNCIIAGDFIKKAYGYCRTVCMMCRLYFLYVLYIMYVLYTLYILCILDLKNMTAYNIEKKKIRYKKNAIYTRLPTD